MPDATVHPHHAEANPTGDLPPVNVRLSLPFLRWRFYFAIQGGPERRGAARLAAERGRHPLRTPGNVLLVITAAMVVYLATLGLTVL